MTSRRCFFKLLKEDFRHKIWMLVLSVLGNLLAIPVCFLLRDGGHYTMANAATQIFRSASDAVYGFQTYISVTAGSIAFAGALIVGLAGFRYVFHRDMTDTYHSIPVRRRTLFLVNWLSGFLIWFVPFFLCMLGTMAFAAGKLGRLRTAFEAAGDKTQQLTANFAALSAGKVFAEGLQTVLTLTVVFLLVYHLVLAAVMSCGNVLNTLAVTAIAGVGVISLYVLTIVFRNAYFLTAVSGVSDITDKVIYASPLVSAVWTLNERHNGELTGVCLAVNAAIALLLLAAAFLAYLRRPSELAETGVGNRAVRVGTQTVATCAAGLGGWLVFYYLTEGLASAQTKAWGVFGVLLAAVLVFGVMEILFRMDLKAFFSHRIRMAATTAGILLVCFCFCEDWLGYDSYLPQKDKIAELSVYAPQSNSLYQYSYMSDSTRERMEQMHYTDVDVIYDYLETAVGACSVWQEGTTEADWEEILTRVTLKNGMSYYRCYKVYADDCDAAREILADEDYQELYYRLSEEELQEVTGIVLETWSQTLQQMKGTDISAEGLEEICRACNQDLKEKPELLLCGGGRIFADLSVKKGENRRNYWRFPVYEEMTHTREVLRKYGFGEYADPKTSQQVEKIKIYLGWSGYELKEQQLDPVEAARRHFGVQEADGAGQQVMSTEMTQAVADSLQDEELVVEITDKQEIEELLEIISYVSAEAPGAFRQERVGNIRIVTEDGKERYVYVPKGEMPEKYLLRFGELTK